MKNIKAGLLGLMLDLYDRTDPGLRKIQERFASCIKDILQQSVQIVYTGIANKKQEVSSAVERFEREGVSIIIVVHFSYAPSLISAESLIRTGIPILIWNTQKMERISANYSDRELLENHGMHGVQDLANVLGRSRRKFILVTGHWKDRDTLENIKRWIDAGQVVSTMKNSRVGLIGHTFPGMGDFRVDEKMLSSQVGPRVCRITTGELARAANTVKHSQISAGLKLIKKRFRGYEKIEPGVLEESVKIELALRNIIGVQRLSGIAIHYPVITANPEFSALPFLAVSNLLADGIGFGGEGDITSAVACILMKEIAGEVNFTEMFTMDFVKGEILMSHFAEGNWKMANPGYPVRIYQKSGWLSPTNPSAALGFTFKPGRITLLNLTSTSDGSIKLITAAGTVKDRSPLKLEKPHFIFKPDIDLKEFLNAYSYEGGSHHLAMAYGDHSEAIKRVAYLMDIECKTI